MLGCCPPATTPRNLGQSMAPWSGCGSGLVPVCSRLRPPSSFWSHRFFFLVKFLWLFFEAPYCFLLSCCCCCCLCSLRRWWLIYCCWLYISLDVCFRRYRCNIYLCILICFWMCTFCDFCSFMLICSPNGFGSIASPWWLVLTATSSLSLLVVRHRSIGHRVDCKSVEAHDFGQSLDRLIQRKSWSHVGHRNVIAIKRCIGIGCKHISPWLVRLKPYPKVLPIFR